MKKYTEERVHMTASSKRQFLTAFRKYFRFLINVTTLCQRNVPQNTDACSTLPSDTSTS